MKKTRLTAIIITTFILAGLVFFSTPENPGRNVFAQNDMSGHDRDGTVSPDGSEDNDDMTNPGGCKPVVLNEVAQSERQWTGVAVSDDRRIFVNYPLWVGETQPVAVAEIADDGTAVPYPDEKWNSWTPSVEDPENYFICVQSVYTDDEDYLWILDPANPRFEGVVEGGPKLVKIDLENDKVIKKYFFGSDVAPKNSYLNDVRVDTKEGFAYITDSGMGAIIALNLETGRSRRVLDRHFSTKSENLEIVINTHSWLNPDGSRPQVHADGIALDPEEKYLYYHVLTGDTLYGIPTEYLNDFEMSEDIIESNVDVIKETGACDGMLWHDGYVYLSNIMDNAIKRFNPETGYVELLAERPEIAWPDSFSTDGNGNIYFTTSKIHLTPDPEMPYMIYMFKVE